MTNKYESFNLEIEDNIANIILSRPEQLNSMSRKFWVELPEILEEVNRCLLYTSPSPRDLAVSRMPSSA